jgi:hypothetical protein
MTSTMLPQDGKDNFYLYLRCRTVPKKKRGEPSIFKATSTAAAISGSAMGNMITSG